MSSKSDTQLFMVHLSFELFQNVYYMTNGIHYSIIIYNIGGITGTTLRQRCFARLSRKKLLWGIWNLHCV